VSGQVAWADAIRALEIFASDPDGLGGLWLRARAGPVRTRFLSELARLLPQARRLHPGTDDETLFGGIDVAATLAAGRPLRRAGLLSGGGVLVLTMAERCTPGLAARLGGALDGGGLALIALDEGQEDEAPPPALTERLGLFVTLDGIAQGDARPGADLKAVEKARGRLARVTLADPDRDALVRGAAGLGIASLRPPLLAAACARASAARSGNTTVEPEDLARAAALVLAHRAIPAGETAPPEPDPPPSPPDPGEGPGEQEQDVIRLPEELLIEAARAALPPGLLLALQAGRASRMAKGAGGAGAARKGNRRGRPVASRPGRLGSGERLDIVATLRAAAPYQRLRRSPERARPVELRAEDFRVRRFQERSDRLVIFLVDASGSLALTRLGEAKGAVELLLAEAYVRRDHVALVAFRGAGAELLLPPTRSLVQTKRRLAGLPGGGGTPLASGLRAALDLAGQGTRRGFSPSLVVLTDGRANVALDGAQDRTRAGEDAATLARAVAMAGVGGVVIDTGTRPSDTLATLARLMRCDHVALPRADAHAIGRAVSARW
jgi:magnesium chelatase subunit D